MALQVAVVTQDEPFFLPEFYQTFFAALPGDIDLRRITILPTMDEPKRTVLRQAYQLFGPVNVIRYGFEYARRNVADTLGAGTYSVESVARDHNCTVEHRMSVNTRSYREQAADLDVVLSVSAPEIFKPELLSAPEWGCINVHTSNLPKYRGMLPTFWAMYHGDDELGVTVHTMAAEVDKGEILRQEMVSIPDGAALTDVITLGKRTGGRLAASVLSEIRDGAATPRPMEGDSSYFSFPTAEDRREFQRRGGEIL